MSMNIFLQKFYRGSIRILHKKGILLLELENKGMTL